MKKYRLAFDLLILTYPNKKRSKEEMITKIKIKRKIINR